MTSKKSILRLASLAVIFSVTIGFFSFTCCAKKEPGVIKIGAILSLTGEAASYGNMMKKGMEIAIDEVNAKGGIKDKPLKIIYEDSQFLPKLAINAAKKLIEADKVKVITGITGSKNALSIVPLAIYRKVVIIDALSSSPELSKYGGKFYFRIMPSDLFAGRFITQWSLRKGWKKVSIFFANDDWGNGILRSAKEKLESQGGRIVVELAVEPGTKDFRSLIRKLVDPNPEVIFLFAYAPEAGIIIKQLKERGINLPIIGSDNLSASEFLNVGKDVVEGVMFILPVEGEGEVYFKFREKFRKRYGEHPSINSIKSYDVVKLASYTIEKVGYDGEKISNLLSSLKNYVGASGSIEFDKHGDIVNPRYQLMIYKGGKYKAYEE